jgi:hypothetical protein
MTVTLQVDNNNNDNKALVILDVHDADSNEVYASLQVTREQFVSPNTNQDFVVPFTTPIAGCKLVSITSAGSFKCPTAQKRTLV